MPSTTARAELGRRVRARREALGYSQEALVASSDLHWSWLGRVERGQVNPTFENVLKLADLLEMDAGELLTGLRYGD